MGVWSKNDVLFSRSLLTVEERNSANIDATIERVKDMGWWA